MDDFSAEQSGALDMSSHSLHGPSTARELSLPIFLLSLTLTVTLLSEPFNGLPAPPPTELGSLTISAATEVGGDNNVCPAAESLTMRSDSTNRPLLLRPS